MAGRGRGRGRGLSINIEALGLGRGELVTHVVAQPPPLYPPLPSNPVPLPKKDDVDYLLALKQELRESFLKSPFYVSGPNKLKDIERYSDKYQVGSGEASSTGLAWSRLPQELREKRKRKKATVKAKPNIKATKIEKEDVGVLFAKLEETSEVVDGGEDADAGDDKDPEKKKENKEDDEEEEDEEYDEEDLEEETDYNLSYFDNGEGYGDEDEDDDEGPTY